MKIPFQVVAYFDSELDAYKHFVEVAERSWVEELARYNCSLGDEEQGDELWRRFEYRQDLWSSLSDVYPQYQRKSNLIMLLSLFEDFLNQLCDSVKFHCKLQISFSDFAGSGIERAKNYLVKAASLSLPLSGPEWSKINNAQSIRNVITHAAGHIDPKKHAKQLNIVNCDNYLSCEEYARVHLVIKEEFIFVVITNMKSFCNKLLPLCKNLSIVQS